MMYRIAGVGCSLLDKIYLDVDFSSESFHSVLSVAPGDGGLEPGKLTFTDDFERFTGKGCQAVLGQITGGAAPNRENVGGPAVVALIHAAQVLPPQRFAVSFLGTVGRDPEGRVLMSLIAKTPLNAQFLEKPGHTPFTYVLSDPGHHAGKGERSFVNNVGTAGQLTHEDLPPEFFEADLVVFGGTALVPQIHDSLDLLLKRVKDRGGLTVVTTVYDFRNEQRNPCGRWPLGNSDKAYGLVDVLLTDHEEALRLSGEATAEKAVAFFLAAGVGAVVVTQGASQILVATSHPGYRPLGRSSLPASRAVIQELLEHPERKGDTTGCGDNFAGGVIASLAVQRERKQEVIDLMEAVAWGAVAGGLACFQVGGVTWEATSGQKQQLLEPYLKAYYQDLASSQQE